MRALVVGYGRMGAFHAKVLRDLGCEVATVDPDRNQRADFTSLADVAGFDVAAVAVPAQDLLDTAYQLAGTPLMLVEKPFALNVRDARLLAAYLEQEGSRVCAGLVERFNPVARSIRALVRDGTLRDVQRVKFTRWSDRPSFDIGLDLRLHDVDLAAFINSQSADVEFDTRARTERKVRTVDVTHAEGTTTFDLMSHDLSPLHGLWHAFLTDGEYPKPHHVIDALESLGTSEQQAESLERLVGAAMDDAWTPFPSREWRP